LLCATASLAQQSHTLSLKEAIAYGRQHSPALVIATNDIYKAKAQAAETRGALLPQISAGGQLDDNIKRQTTYLPAGIFSETPMPVQLGTQYATTFSIQSEQSLLDLSLRQAVRANEPNMAMARIRNEQAEEQLVYDASRSYAQALIYQEQVRLLAENQKQYDELVPILKLRLEKGVAQQLEVDRVEVTRRNIISQRTVAEANYELALAQLQRVIGMPLGDELTLSDPVELASGLRTPSARPFTLHTLSSHRLTEQSILLKEIELKRRRYTRLPTLTSYSRFGALAQGDDFGGHFDTWNSYNTIGLKMSMPLFSGFRRTSQIKQAEIDLVNAREQMKLNELGWQLDYRNAGTRMTASQSTVRNDEENLHLAEQVFANTNLQYQQGLAPLSDLLNADYQLQEARNNYTTSLLNHYIATIDVEKAKGSLLEFAQTL
jgi:outer membrane protein